MSVVHGLLLGIFVLVLTYLGVKNAGGVTAIFNSGGAQGISAIKTLQGR